MCFIFRKFFIINTLCILCLLAAPTVFGGTVMVDAHPTITNLPGSHASDTSIALGQRVILGPDTTLNPSGGVTDPCELVDGNDKDALLQSAEARKTPLSVTVDLGKRCDIASISIMTTCPDARGLWNREGDLSVSDDGVTFVHVTGNLSATQLLNRQWEEGAGWKHTYSSGGTVRISGSLNGYYLAKHVRYVKLKVPPTEAKDGGWPVSEIAVETTPGLVIPKPSAPIIVDGNLSEWRLAAVLNLNRAAKVRIGAWQGPAQLSGKVLLMVNDNTLYVAADITKEGPANNDLRGDDAKNRDCVELFLELRDMNNDATDFNALIPGGVRQGSGYEYEILLNPGSPQAKPQIWFVRKNTGMGRLEERRIRGTNDTIAVGGQIAVANAGNRNGYVIEAAIPLGNFGQAKVEPGMQIGLDAAINTAAKKGGGRVQLVHNASQEVASSMTEWGRGYVNSARARQSATGTVTITVDGNIARSFNGHDTIMRTIFGLESYSPGMAPQTGATWNLDSGCFGRTYFGFDDAISRFKLPGMEGKTEEEKRALVFNPDYWKKVDMAQVLGVWPEWVGLAKLKPRQVFVMFYGAPSQFAAEPVLGTTPPKLTPEREALMKKYPVLGSEINTILSRSPGDRSPFFLKDKELYAEICVNILAKIKAIFPSDTTFSVTLDNEINWPTMIWNKAIVDDMFDSWKKYGDYQAGNATATAWLKQYNPLYTAIKKRFPEVRVGGPDVCAVDFTPTKGGRVMWDDFLRPILDGAIGLDFFDYHYGVHPKRAQAIAETVGQYWQRKHGRPIPAVDSEASAYVFRQSPEPLNQFKQGIIIEREWFGLLRNPDLSYGWSAISLAKFFDGFGRANGVAMPMVMFRPLHGQYVQSESTAPGMGTVAAIQDKQLTAIAFNDHGEYRETLFKLRAPGTAKFTLLRAQLLWYDFKAGKIQHAVFEPTALIPSRNVSAAVKLPPFSTCTLQAEYDHATPPERVMAQERHIGDKVVFRVAPEHPEVLTVTLPATALTGTAKRYLLRVAIEGTTLDSATVRVNGRGTFSLPAQIATDSWDKNELVEFELDRRDLQEKNRLVFSVNPGGKPYAVLMASVMVQDVIKGEAPEKEQTISLDLQSPGCKITEEESKTLPDSYLAKTSQIGDLPVLLASWNFDVATGGGVSDLSGHANSGKLMNGAMLGDGVKGKALVLKGKGEYFRVEDSPLFHFGKDQSFSLSLWLKMAPGKSGTIFSRGVDKSITLVAQNSGYGDEFPYTMIRYQLSSPTAGMYTVAKGNQRLDDDKWHQVVAVRDAPEGVTLIYVDGVYVGSGAGLLYGDLASSSPLLFGISAGQVVSNQFSITANAFSGLIDEVNIYAGVLTPQQIKKAYSELADKMRGAGQLEERKLSAPP
ncbi:MAG: LamG-like jellyroll fold domain-containing protein [Lentisphaeria bacterium]